MKNKSKELLELAKKQYLYNKQTGIIEIEIEDLQAFAEEIVKLFAIPDVSNYVNCETCKYLGKEHDRYCDNCNSENSLYEAINDC